MPDWLSYSLGDAQIFSARSYDRLVERCMQDAWPAQPLVLALGMAVLALLAWRPVVGARALMVMAALGCAAVAGWWLPHCYTELHWAAGGVAVGFALQALLLAAAAAWPAALRRAAWPGAREGAMVLFAVALVAMPWLSLPSGGGSAWRAEWAGLMPGPSIAVALAVVPLCAPRWCWLVLPLPLAGGVLEAVTLASIDRVQWVLLPLQAAVLGVVLWRVRRVNPVTRR
jgi:hypothetical protein